MEEFLCYVSFVGTDSDNLNIYEMYFTKDADDFWGENFEYMPCCLVNEMKPDSSTYSNIKVIKTKLKLAIVTESCCHSMQDCMDGVIALAWEDMSDYEAYPEDGRIVLPYGMPEDDLIEMLSVKNIELLEKETNATED